MVPIYSIRLPSVLPTFALVLHLRFLYHHFYFATMFATSAFILLLSAAALTVAAPVTSTFSVTATALADTPTLSGTASDDAS